MARAEACGPEAATASEGPATTTPAAKEMMESTKDAEFRLAVEVFYHGRRQAFLAGAHRWMMFATIVLGASAATTIGNEKVLGLMAAAAAALDIAFDLVGGSQAHADMRRRYLELAARLDRGELTEDDFGAEWIRASADEPPMFPTVALIAHRDACRSLGRQTPELIPLVRRLTAHFWRW